jgi:hypothetical protein
MIDGLMGCVNKETANQVWSGEIMGSFPKESKKDEMKWASSMLTCFFFISRSSYEEWSNVNAEEDFKDYIKPTS